MGKWLKFTGFVIFYLIAAAVLWAVGLPQLAFIVVVLTFVLVLKEITVVNQGWIHETEDGRFRFSPHDTQLSTKLQ